jgi:hypothetical protein
MTLSLPIPGKKAAIKFYYIPYEIKEGGTNFKGEIKVSDTESVATMRQMIFEKYNLPAHSYLITQVQENYVKKIIDRNTKVDDFESSYTTLFYEVRPDLNPRLDGLDKYDDNFGVGDEWTKVVIQMMQVQKQSYSTYTVSKTFNIPRIVWVNKKWTLKQVHLEIFKFYLNHIVRLYDEKDAPPFRAQSIDEAEQGKLLSKEEFLALSLED